MPVSHLHSFSVDIWEVFTRTSPSTGTATYNSLSISGHWQTRSYFETYIFSTLAVWGGVMWTVHFDESLFCSYSGGLRWVHLGGQNGIKREKRVFPLKGKGRREWVWAGWDVWGTDRGGESWEFVTGHLFEIYSNFFNCWRANSRVALIVGGQILGRAPPHFHAERA